jgi:hypothetical protein
LTGLLIGVLDFKAAMLTGQLSFAMTDDLRLALGGVGYLSSRDFSVFYGFEYDNRAFLELRWDFNLL